tara:strand:+ start:8752 stop:9738 length:987 start_codon:yes stop_codon:yes gene_type:complete
MIISGIVLICIVILILLGYASGNQPVRNSVTAAQQDLGIALENKQIRLGDISLNVVFAGPENGKPVILLHGYPEFWYAWRGPMVALAQAGYRVIIPDQRGYNDSDKPSDYKDYTLDKLAGDIAGLINKLGYDKACLAGHDFGGLVAWWTLILHPEMIEKFVIINKPHPKAYIHYRGEGEKVSWYRTFLRIPIIPGYIGRLGNWFLLVKNLRSTSLPATFPDKQINLFRSAWATNGAINSMGAWYRANANFELDVDMNISVPGLFIAAPNDSFSPQGMGQLSLAFLANGELLELDEGSHWVIQEKPQFIGQTLVDYFNLDIDATNKQLT